jgi:hypothetical protein
MPTNPTGTGGPTVVVLTVTVALGRAGAALP